MAKSGVSQTRDNSCERKVHLIVCLHPNDDGFSIAVRKPKANATSEEDEWMETMRLPYEDDEFLDYIENGELPPCLLDVIDSNDERDQFLDLFHCGSVFVEIRDYRNKNGKCKPAFDSKWVKLKPSNLTLINDIAKLTSSWSFNHRNWTRDEQIDLEARLVLATSDALCLDPNPKVALVANKLQFQRKWMKSSFKIQRLSKKFSQSSINRMKKLQSLRPPKELNLHEFLKQRTDHPSTTSRLNKSTNVWRERKTSHHIISPKSIEVEKVAKVITLPQNKLETGLVKIEEIHMEFVDPDKRSPSTIAIFHRPVDDAYFGQLCVNKHQGNSNGASCLFQFGNKQLTKKYIDQFIDILSENGRKSIKITQHVAGLPPKVTYNFATNVPTFKEPEKNVTNQSPAKKTFAPSISVNAPITHSYQVQQTQQTQQPTHQPLPQTLPKTISSGVTATANTTDACHIIPGSSPASNLIPIHRTNSLASLTKVPSLPIHPSTVAKPETALAVILTAHPVANPNAPTTQGPKSETLQEAIASSLQNTTVNATSVTTTTSLPSGINLANLSLASVQNLRLHNLVSLTNVQGVPQGIALPISLTMMPTTAAAGNASVSLHNQPTTAFMTSSGNMIVGIETPVLQSQLVTKQNER
ncbi:transcription factor SPT20-like protein [Dinothrombium tinctorium]|uniref:Transcription factor SPT20-like protein n=1 Tax=Dinothrombium tinctorium TaxID=1965070 RepID=A0A3S3PMC0_9ACAR|nr:transcription factor SPT20-like protein [Dinothrombium tinctorium]RWS15539.1 transcription factor SPT20-like protein [Dinothrombium tinctorium]